MPPQAATGTGRHRAIVVGVGLSSAAVLIFEIALTRVFAVGQFHHFAYVTVSLALLGFGASGSLLTAFPALGRGGPRRWAQLAGGQSLSTIGAYVVVNEFPFDSFSIAWDSRQILLLALNYVVLAVPFLFGGAIIGILLAGWDQDYAVASRRVYAASLVGAGLGCVVALGGVALVGGVGVIMVSAAGAMAAALSFERAKPVRPQWGTAGLSALAVLLAGVAVAPPRVLDLELSQYKGLSGALRFPGSEVVSTRWSTGTRVDHIRSEGIRSLPGLSFTFPGNPPPQDGLTFDGDDLSPIPLVTPENAEFGPYLLSSLPYQLRPDGRAAVLEPRGGLEVIVALASGADAVIAVEPSRAAVRAVGESDADIYADPRVRTVIEEPRVFVERTGQQFDVVSLALTSPYRPVTSGAYSLAEDYRLTTDAFDAYLSRLQPGGILSVMRWLQVPPSEESRLVALASEAVSEVAAEPDRAIVALRSFSNVLVLVKPDHFTAAELAAIEAFADSRRFDLIAAPGLTAEAANRYNLLPRDEYYPIAAALLSADDLDPVYAESAFAINPPDDDRPFFYHFFKWSQASEVLDTLGKAWQPFGGAGYFVLIALLGLATASAIVLIAGPLAIRRSRGTAPPGMRGWVVAYFSLLGLAFLLVEIPIVQRYILLIGQPTSALAVVLFALLLASGIGSLLSTHVPWRAGAAALTVAAVAYSLLLPTMTGIFLSAPRMLRMVLGGAALLPLGFLMGTMFPKGLAHLEDRAPALVPWAWGVNGVASVISAVAAALLALSFGFSAVIALGAGCYGLAALLARSDHGVATPRPESGERTRPAPSSRRPPLLPSRR